MTFEITQTCNLGCVHCYNFDRDLPRHPDPERAGALTAPEIHRIIDEVREEGALFLAFTGGEPTVHPSLPDFVAHAARSGMFTRLKSNGTQLTAARVARLVEAGLRAIDVSVYGARAETHDAFVRSSGAFDRTIAGLQRARDANLAVQISFVVSTANAGEAEAMEALANGLGVPHSFDPHMKARYDGTRSSLDLSIDRAVLEQLYRGPFSRYLPISGKERRLVACPCARSVCGIGSSGEVYPCMGAPLPAGNLRTGSFRDVWRNSPVFQWVRGLRNEDFPTCASCTHQPYCRRNSGTMLTNTGSFTGPAYFGEDLVCAEAELVHRLVEERSPTPASAEPPSSPLR